MSDIAIKVRGLGKKYHIGEKLPQRRLTEAIKNAAGFPWKVAKSLISGKALDQREEFWALKDVAFDVKQGEVLGIIGRNGAGKSTLLKILSRITTPTEGEVELFGRVGCLLEVGTGFHPELTGRENVFLNGSLLGMSNVEIKQRFDEIVDFSGVERFLDTPVKFYSSGMYTRLAFSVAAHLNPEILIVDEVLAVGDAEFQKKCLGKMDSIAKSGRTIIFVSHNMQAIITLCKKAILLESGKITQNCDVRIACEQYLNFSTSQSKSAQIVWPFENAPGNHLVKLHEVSICSKDGRVNYNHFCRDSFLLTITFWCLKPTTVLPNFHVYNNNGIFVFVASNLHIEKLAKKIYDTGLYRCTFEIPAPLLNAGKYSVHALLSREGDGSPFVHIPDAVSFQILDDGTGRGNIYQGECYPGIIRPLLACLTEKIDTTSSN